jgi:hypothetical protein
MAIRILNRYRMCGMLSNCTSLSSKFDATEKNVGAFLEGWHYDPSSRMRNDLSCPPASGFPTAANLSVSPPAPYIGGKRNLWRRLCVLIDAPPTTLTSSRSSAWAGSFSMRTRQPRAGGSKRVNEMIVRG